MPRQGGNTGHESRIDSALGKILRHFNLLELNLGLCIRSLENPGEVGRSHSWLARSSLQEKAERFSKLVRERDLVEDQRELDDWNQAVLDARSFRNYYVHGGWEYYPLRKQAPIGFRIPPWRAEEVRGSSAPTMNLEDLEADAGAVQLVFEQFVRLRRKYGV